MAKAVLRYYIYRISLKHKRKNNPEMSNDEFLKEFLKTVSRDSLYMLLGNIVAITLFKIIFPTLFLFI